MAAPSSPSGPEIDTDAYCRRCTYNLRGLSGDPVRCPECGQLNTLTDLLDIVTPARRVRAIQGAGDALVLAAFSLAGGVVAGWTSRSTVIAVVLLVLGGVLVQQALRTCRRMIPASVDWPNLFTAYFLYTCALPATPIGVWWIGAILTWRVRMWLMGLADNQDVEIVDFVTATPFVAVILFVARPLRRIRWKQRRAFVRLIRAIRAAPADSPADIS